MKEASQSYQSSAPSINSPLHTAEDHGSDADSAATDPRFRPFSPPPAAAPPSPPPTPLLHHNWKKSTPTDFKASYGTQGNEPNNANGHASSNTNSLRGDASLRPNIGLNNSYEYSLFGWTLQQLIINLRTTNLIASALTLIWALFSWLGKAFTFQLRSVVLLIYLVVLTLALFLVDIMGFYRTQLSQRGITSSDTHTFVMEERVRDQLGLLYHPGGKAGYLIFLAVLCGCIGDLVLRLIAVAYCFSAFGYIYAYNMYPEFRRTGTSQSHGSTTQRRGFWAKQAWSTMGGRGAAEAAARNWSTRWGLGTGPTEDNDSEETQSFLRHNATNAPYTYV